MKFGVWVDILNEQTETQYNMQLNTVNAEQLGFVGRREILDVKIDEILSALQAKKVMLRFLIGSSHKKTFDMIRESFEVMLRDAYYDFVSVYQRLKIVKEMNDYSFNIYNVRLTIQQNRIEKKTSKYLQMFNFIAMLYLPITLIANSFGCNFKVPYQSGTLVDTPDDERYFFSIMGICLGILIFEQIVFKKLGWY